MSSFSHATLLDDGMTLRILLNRTSSTVVNPDGFSVAIGGLYNSYSSAVGLAPVRNSDGSLVVTVSPVGDAITISLENPISSSENVCVSYDPGDFDDNTLDGFQWTQVDNQSSVDGPSWATYRNNCGVVLSSSINVVMGVIVNSNTTLQATEDGWLLDGQNLYKSQANDIAINNLREVIQSHGPVKSWIFRNVSKIRFTVGFKDKNHRLLFPGDQLYLDGTQEELLSDPSIGGAVGRGLAELIPN